MDWPAYHGDQAGTHYSSLDQINRRNVRRLRLAWSFDTRDAFDDGVTKSTMEDNPLVIDGLMYIVSPKGRLICLDAATGVERWAFDPAPPIDPVRKMIRQRGVAIWRGPGGTRIFYSFRHSLIAIDAETGRPIASFGNNGRIDLRDGIDRPRDAMTIANVSPGIVFRDLIILGSTGQGPGDIRAYDVRTGRVRWVFHTIPHPGEFGYDTWPKDAWKFMNGVNAWAGMSLDEARGLVFVPLASPGAFQKDFYGADRPGDNLFGTSLVALDAASGRRIWHFPFVRHDLWDRDPPAPPTLVSVWRTDHSCTSTAHESRDSLSVRSPHWAAPHAARRKTDSAK